jgi:putative oxidoreductase
MITKFRILHWLSCFILAGIFIYSGYVKYLAPLQFAVAIEGYKLAPAALVWPLAKYLPLFEIALGIFLLSGWKIRYSAMLTAGLLLFFIVVLTITYARGIDADCGCFSLNDKISPITIARDSIILLPALFLIFEPRLRSRFGNSIISNNPS